MTDHDTPQPEFVTVEDLQNEIGVTRHTFIRWAEMGLIPAPTIVQYGRGRRGQWPAWVRKRVQFIRDSINAGATLEAVKNVLLDAEVGSVVSATKWAADVAEKWRQPGTANFVKPRRQRSVIDDYVYLLREKFDWLGLSTRRRDSIIRRATSGPLVVETLTLIGMGVAPVLIYNPPHVVVTADFATSFFTSWRWEQVFNATRHERGQQEEPSLGQWVMCRVDAVFDRLFASSKTELPEHNAGGEGMFNIAPAPLVWVSRSPGEIPRQYRYSVGPARNGPGLRIWVHEDTATFVAPADLAIAGDPQVVAAFDAAFSAVSKGVRRG